MWKVQPQLADAARGRLSICLDLTQKLCVIIMIKVPVCGTDRQTGRLTVRWVSGKTPTLKHISISRRTDGGIPRTKPHLQLPAAAGYLVCGLWSYSLLLSLYLSHLLPVLYSPCSHMFAVPSQGAAELALHKTPVVHLSSVFMLYFFIFPTQKKTSQNF